MKKPFKKLFEKSSSTIKTSIAIAGLLVPVAMMNLDAQEMTSTDNVQAIEKSVDSNGNLILSTGEGANALLGHSSHYSHRSHSSHRSHYSHTSGF